MTNPIHIRFEKDLTLLSKKNILESEMNMLKVSKHFASYYKLREQELKTKERLSKKIKGMINTIKRLDKTLPEPNVPKHIKAHHHTKTSKIKQAPIQTPHSTRVEDELAEIQRQLDSLG